MQKLVAIVIFLKLLVSGNAILNIANTNESFIFLAFPSNVGRFEWLENCDFIKISKFVNFQIFIFFRLSNTYHIYYCFLLDFTLTLLPAIELVSIWCTLYRMSTSISILNFILRKRRIVKQV